MDREQTREIREARKFVEVSLARGLSVQEIKTDLRKIGLDGTDIHRAFKEPIVAPKKIRKPLKLTLPKITLPKIKIKPLPKLTLPKLKLPKITIPKLTLPKIHIKPKKVAEPAPKVVLESLSIPPPMVLSEPKKVRKPLPTFTLPKITIPKLTLPKLTIPKIKIKPLPKVKLPKLTIPKITIPKVKLPKITIPKITLPKLTLPKIHLKPKEAAKLAPKVVLGPIPAPPPPEVLPKPIVESQVYRAQKPLPYVALGIIVLMVSLGFLFIQSDITGFATVQKETSYSDSIDSSFSTSSIYSWFIENPGNITSITLKGEIGREGSVKISLEHNGETYVVLDSSLLNASDGEYFTDELVELTIEDAFANLSSDKICTLWDVDSSRTCYGSSACCSSLGLEQIRENYNETYFLNYVDSFIVNVSAQQIYYDVDLEVPRSDIRYGEEKNFSVVFKTRTISFESACVETCSINEFNESFYALTIEVDNASVYLESVEYLLSEVAPNTPPAWKQMPSFTTGKNELLAINLNEYVFDAEDDVLAYSAFDASNLTIEIVGSVAYVMPDYDYVGKQYIYFVANDSEAVAYTNTFEVNVKEDVNASESLEQFAVVINQPVKWKKSVVFSDSVTNASINLSHTPLNVTVFEAGEEISDSLVQIRVDGELQRLDVYENEVRAEKIREKIQELQEEKLLYASDTTKLRELNREIGRLRSEVNALTSITGFAVVSDGEKGFLVRLFEWISGTSITGFAVVDVNDTNSIESNVSIPTIQVNASNSSVSIPDNASVNSSNNSISTNGSNELIISGDSSSLEIEYYTEGPTAVEDETERGKLITVISDIHYENILAYSTIDTKAQAVELYWLKNESRTDNETNITTYYINRTKVRFNSLDNNNDGFIDYVEWIVPSLSSQTYELILITKAVHLDSNRTFIRDVYDYVREQDDNWTTINASEYVRVTFEVPLDNTKDITLYARSNGSSSVEVYLENQTDLVATIENISSEGTYRTLLTSLNDSYDTFDLKIVGDAIEIDYIVDPRIVEVYDNISVGFYNETESTGLGVGLIFNGTNETAGGYNKTTGSFSWLVYYNDTKADFNFTFSIADSNGSAEVLDYCVAHNSCVSYWALDRNSSDSKSNNDGNISGAINGTGISSAALEFDGVNDKILIPGSAELRSSNISFGVWVKLNDFVGDQQPIRAVDGKDGVNFGYTLSISSTNYTFFIRDSGSTLTGVGTPLLDTNFHHIVGTYNGTTMSIYVDGILKQSREQTGELTYSSGRFLIGQSNSDNDANSLEGAIDEVTIWNQSLTAANITTLYKAGLSQHKDTNWTLETRKANEYNLSNVISIWSFNNGTNGTDETRRNDGNCNTSASCPTFNSTVVFNLTEIIEGILFGATLLITLWFNK